MSGIGMRVRLQNMDLPPRVMKKLADADTQSLMEEIGDYVLSETLLNFEQEQTPEGQPWDKSIRAREGGGKTLQDRGHLRDSYTFDALSDQVEIGSNVIYAAIHHFGGTIKGKDGNLKFKIGNRWSQKAEVEIPARPALGITDGMETEIGDLALDFYERLTP